MNVSLFPYTTVLRSEGSAAPAPPRPAVRKRRLSIPGSMASPRSMQRAGRRSRRSEDDLPHPHRETVAADDADGDQRPDPEGEGEEGENLGAAPAGRGRGGGLRTDRAVGHGASS